MLTFLEGNPARMPYTPASAVDDGTVIVVGDLPLIAHRDMAADELESLAAGGGMYRGPKVAGTAISAGAKVYWDDTNDEITPTASTHKCIGYAGTEGALAADTEVEILHKPGG